MAKNLTIAFIIIFFVGFVIFELRKSQEYDVLKIISPTKIVIDLNKNGLIDNDETIEIKNIKSFSTTPKENDLDYLKQIKLSASDALRLGYLAENFSKTLLENKKISFANSKITVDGKVYEKLLEEKGLALKTGEPSSERLQAQLAIARKLNLVIFNNKSQKFHKLECKYGLMAHNFQIIPQRQVPKEAKACRFCHSKKENYKKEIFKESWNEIPQPPLFYQFGNIKIALTDMTTILKPTNKCSTKACQIILKEINSAQNSIDFAIYGYTKVTEIENALKQAQNRGVNIRFVYDLSASGKNIYPHTILLSQILKQNNHDTSSKIMHNKFFIFDNQKVITGSANLSNTDMSGFNSNVVILINSAKIAQIYKNEFEQMYEGLFHNEKSSHKFEQDEKLKIYFSPQDKPLKTKVIPLVNNSTKYIYIPAFLITHKELTQSLIDAKKRGVDVRIILDATNTHSGSHSKITELRKYIPVKTEIFAGKLHSKTIIIDDKYTIIGSMNFSKSGENSNDENMLIIENNEIAKFYKKFFVYMWTKIPEKWLKLNARAESKESIGSCSDGIDNDFDEKIDKLDEGCFVKK